MSALSVCLEALRDTELHRRIGWVREMQGLAIDASGPDAAIGELCRIKVRRHSQSADAVGDVLAEVVGLKQGRVTLMPYGSVEGIASGCEVRALRARLPGRTA